MGRLRKLRCDAERFAAAFFFCAMLTMAGCGGGGSATRGTSASATSVTVTASKPVSRAEDPTVPVPGSPPLSPPYWQDQHQGYLTRAREGHAPVVFLGDSITQDWAEYPALWQERFGARGAVNFGISGDRTQNLLWRIGDGTLNGTGVKVVVLMIGTNNLFRSGAWEDERTVLGVTEVVRAIQVSQPQTKVLLLGIPPAYDSPLHPIRPRIQGINEQLARLDNGGTIRFLDLGPLLLNTDGTLPTEVSPDGVHLGAEGYRRCADALQPLLNTMLG